MKTADEEIHKQFFPMKLPASIVARSIDQDSAQEAIETINHLIFPPNFKQALGLFAAPEERHKKLEPLQKLHAHSNPEWILFYNDKDEPIGWFYGYMEDGETFFIDTIGLVPVFRGQGIYSAFLKQLIAYLKAMGYERLTTSHNPNNRAVLIADLKAGFNIVGLELHESHGPQVKTAYHLHEDRRQAFERVFSMTRT
ncbi:MAG: GNAT family N-acetyltransferase [Chloroflexi bacterium]|nr:GNAT family N-acetyltransferase [Chloroflexota bacterium]